MKVVALLFILAGVGLIAWAYLGHNPLAGWGAKP